MWGCFSAVYGFWVLYTVGGLLWGDSGCFLGDSLWVRGGFGACGGSLLKRLRLSFESCINGASGIFIFLPYEVSFSQIKTA